MARATLGRRLRFVELAERGPAIRSHDVDVVVLDTAWTPSSDDRVQTCIRCASTLHAVFAAHDLFAETQINSTIGRPARLGGAIHGRWCVVVVQGPDGRSLGAS